MDDLVAKRAEGTREVLKGLEYTLKKRVFKKVCLQILFASPVLNMTG